MPTCWCWTDPRPWSRGRTSRCGIVLSRVQLNSSNFYKVKEKWLEVIKYQLNLNGPTSIQSLVWYCSDGMTPTLTCIGGSDPSVRMGWHSYWPVVKVLPHLFEWVWHWPVVEVLAHLFEWVCHWPVVEVLTHLFEWVWHRPVVEVLTHLFKWVWHWPVVGVLAHLFGWVWHWPVVEVLVHLFEWVWY